jgi:hypothetical protein
MKLSKKAAQFTPLFLMFMVLMALPILFWRLSVKIDETKQQIGEDQLVLLAAPYDKEDTINYVEKAGYLIIPEVLAEVAKTNGFLAAPCGGTIDSGTTKCAIINKDSFQVCRPEIMETLNAHFNKKLDEYIEAFNEKSFTKLPTNNYETFVEGKNIHAIALLPVKKGLAIKGRELDTLGTMWFAPSFTVQYDHKLETYKDALSALALISQACFKSTDPTKCVSEHSHLTTGWTIETAGTNTAFKIPTGANTICYALDLPPATTPST